MKNILKSLAILFLPSLLFAGVHIQQGDTNVQLGYVNVSSLTISISGSTYTVISSSVVPTVGQYAIASSTNSTVQWGSGGGGGGGSSTTTVQINGTTLSTAATSFNMIPGTGVLITGSTTTANSVNLTYAADTAIMLSRATDQAHTDKACFSTTGNTTYTCNLNPALTQYTTGQCLTLIADTSNSTTATLNVNTLGALSILGPTGGALSAGNITAGAPATVCLSSPSSTGWILQGGGSGGGANPGGTPAQIQYQVNGTTFGGIPGSVVGTSSITVGPLVVTTSTVVTINSGDLLLAVSSSTLVGSATDYSLDTFGNSIQLGSATASSGIFIGSAGSYVLLAATSTAANIIDVSTTSHLNAPAPSVQIATVTSCGAGASLVGSDIAGTITTGAASPTACTLTFGRPYNSTPVCLCGANGATACDPTSISSSSVTFTLGVTETSIKYICIGRD